MKKFLIILSALICASLTACGSTAQTSETSNSESVAMAEQVTDTPETEEITEEETEEITEEEPETEEKSNEVSDELHASIQHEIDSPEWVRNLPAAQDENNKQLWAWIRLPQQFQCMREMRTETGNRYFQLPHLWDLTECALMKTIKRVYRRHLSEHINSTRLLELQMTPAVQFPI